MMGFFAFATFPNTTTRTFPWILFCLWRHSGLWRHHFGSKVVLISRCKSRYIWKSFCGIIFVIVIHLASHLDTMKVLLGKTISEIFLKIRPRDDTWRHVTSRDHYFWIFALQIADYSKIGHRWGIKMYMPVKSILVPFQRGVNHPSTTILRKVVLVWISQICQKMGFSYISPYWKTR